MWECVCVLGGWVGWVGGGGGWGVGGWYLCCAKEDNRLWSSIIRIMDPHTFELWSFLDVTDLCGGGGWGVGGGGGGWGVGVGGGGGGGWGGGGDIYVVPKRTIAYEAP